MDIITFKDFKKSYNPEIFETAFKLRRLGEMANRKEAEDLKELESKLINHLTDGEVERIYRWLYTDYLLNFTGARTVIIQSKIKDLVFNNNIVCLYHLKKIGGLNE